MALTAEQRYRVEVVGDPLRLLMRFTEALITAKQAPVANARSATQYYTF